MTRPDEEEGLRPIGEIVAELPWMKTLKSRVVKRAVASLQKLVDEDERTEAGHGR